MNITLLLLVFHEKELCTEKALQVLPWSAFYDKPTQNLHEKDLLTLVEPLCSLQSDCFKFLHTKLLVGHDCALHFLFAHWSAFLVS